jgi:hypothetical protein
MTETEADLWGVLGRDWWAENGAICRCTDRQIKFSAALHGRATQAKAAALAGYPGDEETLRVVGSRTANSDRVRNLLAMAEAADGEAPGEQLITQTEIDRRLSRMIRSPDPSTALKSTELWTKLENQRRERGTYPEDDGFSDWRLARDMMLRPNGAAAAAMIMRADCALSGIPMFRDLYEALQRDAPEVWELLKRRHSATMLQDLDEKLANPKWQLEARRQMWREIGIDLPDGGAPPLGRIPRATWVTSSVVVEAAND